MNQGWISWVTFELIVSFAKQEKLRFITQCCLSNDWHKSKGNLKAFVFFLKEPQDERKKKKEKKQWPQFFSPLHLPGRVWLTKKHTRGGGRSSAILDRRRRCCLEAARDWERSLSLLQAGLLFLGRTALFPWMRKKCRHRNETTQTCVCTELDTWSISKRVQYIHLYGLSLWRVIWLAFFDTLIKLAKSFWNRVVVRTSSTYTQCNNS